MFVFKFFAAIFFIAAAHAAAIDRSAKRSPDAGGLSARQGGSVDGLLTGPGGLLNGLLDGLLGGSPASDLDARQLPGDVDDAVSGVIEYIDGTVDGTVGDVIGVIDGRQLPDGVDVDVDILGHHVFDRRQTSGWIDDLVVVVDGVVDTVGDELPGDA